METRYLTAEQIEAFDRHLRAEERAPGTIEKYLRDVREFTACLKGEAATQTAVVAWKNELLARALAPCTINSKLVALNAFFRFAGWEDCRAKTLRLQRQTFRDADRELTQTDYRRLLDSAKQSGKKRLFLLMEAICSTGIRVSEVAYLTVEAARTGRADVRLKGKIRTILLPNRLCRKLLKYAKKQKIRGGQIFLTRNGTPISRRQIWAEMKALCARAGVLPGKVFPHNLRHLFARTFYKLSQDIVQLADILGHSSIETTRIYLIATGAEHARQLERMKLLC